MNWTKTNSKTQHFGSGPGSAFFGSPGSGSVSEMWILGYSQEQGNWLKLTNKPDFQPSKHLLYLRRCVSWHITYIPGTVRSYFMSKSNILWRPVWPGSGSPWIRICWLSGFGTALSWKAGSATPQKRTRNLAKCVLRLGLTQRLLNLGCLGPVRPGDGFGFEWYRYHVTGPANRKQESRVGDPWHFGADPYVWLMNPARAPDPDQTPDPTPFFSGF